MSSRGCKKFSPSYRPASKRLSAPLAGALLSKLASEDVRSYRTATGLAAIPGRVQHPSAQQALFPSSRDGDILIKDKKQLMECGVSQQG
jgi:hypothetical protein